MPYKNIEDRRAASKRFCERNLSKFRSEEYLTLSRDKMRRYRQNNPKPELDAGKRWRQKNSDHLSNYRLKRTYGITLGQRDQMFLDQGSRCAICNSNEATSWHVDHCHETMKVRGILCMRCNLLLGKAKDSPEVLRRAADYLERGN